MTVLVGSGSRADRWRRRALVRPPWGFPHWPLTASIQAFESNRLRAHLNAPNTPFGVRRSYQMAVWRMVVGRVQTPIAREPAATSGPEGRGVTSCWRAFRCCRRDDSPLMGYGL